MNNKKTLSIIISVIITFGIVLTTSNAEANSNIINLQDKTSIENTEISKEKAEKIAEEILKKSFDYDVKKEKLTIQIESNTTSEEKYKNVWEIKWHNKDYRICASVYINSTDGKIISAAIEDGTKYVINKKYHISKEEAKKKSDELLKNISANKMKLFNTSNTPKIEYNGDVYKIIYERIENNIKFLEDGEIVCIDAATGKPILYYYIYSNLKFDRTKIVMSQNKADELLKKQLNLNLEYRKDNSSNTMRLVYVPTSEEKIELNAETGDILQLNITKPENIIKDLSEWNKLVFNNLYTSIEKSEEILLENEAEIVMRNKIRKIDKSAGYKIKNLKFTYNYKNENVWSADIYELVDGEERDMGEIIISSKTKTILHYSVNPEIKFPREHPLKKLPWDELYEKAIDYLAKNYRDKIKNIKTEQSNFDTSRDSLCFRFYRTENDIICPENNISVYVDTRSGGLFKLECNWFEDITVSDDKNIISNDQAKESYLQKFKPELRYVIDKNANEQVKLIYILNGNGHINAKTGEIYSDLAK